ncbi:MAG: phage tail assembly chaperone [Comamonas sp.]|jgi:hypothetical protein|uniref:phage tail assembly chaperone n=1 Tax=Comamonas sp. TaxID=34028 RepID=UPI0028281169|nr:phage tail assembly chaperone [Comamonas sp.]MDR0216192.1 phage tail assembly chaperone [Comamonas sp.]
MTKSASQKSVAVASIKSLGGATPNFDMPIKASRADGSVVELTIKVKGMRKSEWARIRDEHIAMLREKGDEQGGEFTFAKLASAGSKEAAELVAKAATGWDLEDDFTAENMVEIEDLVPGSISTILGGIDAALFNGRVGN